jgi:hypothetical protein
MHRARGTPASAGVSAGAAMTCGPPEPPIRRRRHRSQHRPQATGRSAGAGNSASGRTARPAATIRTRTRAKVEAMRTFTRGLGLEPTPPIQVPSSALRSPMIRSRPTPASTSTSAPGFLSRILRPARQLRGGSRRGRGAWRRCKRVSRSCGLRAFSKQFTY